MLTVGQQKIDSFTLLALAAATAAVTVLSVAVPSLLPWSFLVLAAAALLVFWAARWEITFWAWLWVLSYGLLNWPEWHVPVTGFFNMNVPRFVFLAAVAAFMLHFVFHRRRVRFDRPILYTMGILAAYCAISATATGWLAETEAVRTAPYFRFLGAMLFPFIIFFLVYNTTRDQRQIRWPLIALSLYGWYALYIGYLQYAAIMGAAGARAFIWPPYINDPTAGIHFDRARGAFGSGSQQAVLLTLLFYSNLFLYRRISGPYRPLLLLQAVLIPPAIFFTGMRSGYLAFLLCGVLWCLRGAEGRFGRSKLAVAALAVAIGVTVFWQNLAQTRRQTGGVAQLGPIEARKVLLHQTWDIFKQRPLTGAGFGHFVDAQYRLRRDPAVWGTLAPALLVEHNLFLSMLAETGIIGLAVIVLLFYLIFRESRQLYRKLSPAADGYLSRGFVVLFWVAMINFLTDAMFRDTYSDVFANGLFWSLGALVAGFNRLLEPQPLDLPIPGAPLRA